MLATMYSKVTMRMLIASKFTTEQARDINTRASVVFALEAGSAEATAFNWWAQVRTNFDFPLVVNQWRALSGSARRKRTAQLRRLIPARYTASCYTSAGGVTNEWAAYALFSYTHMARATSWIAAPSQFCMTGPVGQFTLQLGEDLIVPTPRPFAGVGYRGVPGYAATSASLKGVLPGIMSLNARCSFVRMWGLPAYVLRLVD